MRRFIVPVLFALTIACGGEEAAPEPEPAPEPVVKEEPKPAPPPKPVIEPLPEDAVRGMILVLAASLARGCSGVRVEVVRGLADLINARITPVVPSRGSVGASRLHMS